MFREDPEQTQEHCRQYWRLENCDVLRRKEDLLKPTSAWLLNTMTGTSTAHKGKSIILQISQLPENVRDHLPVLGHNITLLDRERFQLKAPIAHVWCAMVAGQPQTMETLCLISQISWKICHQNRECFYNDISSFLHHAKPANI